MIIYMQTRDIKYYYINFIDDCTKYYYTYSLKQR
jgi:hypothetical protein